MLERLGEAAAVFFKIDASLFNAVHITVNRWFFAARPVWKCCATKSHAVKSGSRLQKERTEVAPLMAARVYRMSGSTGCWGTLWSKERLVASLTATPRSGVRFGAERIPVF